jgi:hypothetical protein
MTTTESHPPELHALVDAVCADTASEADLLALSNMLADSPAAQQYYLKYCRMHVELFFCCGEQRLNSSLLADIRSPASVSPCPPIPTFIDSTSQGHVGYFASDWLVSYLVATVVFAIGALIGAFTYVSIHEQVVDTSPSRAAKRQLTPLPEVEYVGRVTGMVDCKWEGTGDENLKSEIRNPKSLVALGDTLSLRSGLLEMTYNSGAKVILQGPVTYAVESSAGGYLSVGKLTARVEAKTQDPRPKTHNRSPNPQIAAPSPLSSLPSPLFAVRTPTATVTDLGTEFGVDVQAAGVTAAHVFRGMVEVQPIAADGARHGHAIRLTENESAQVERRPGGKTVEVHRGAANPAIFVRADQLPDLTREKLLKPLRRWQAYSRQLRDDPALIAYYTFEKASGGNATLPNMSAAGRLLDGQIDGAEWVWGRLPGKYALYFHGPGSGDRVALPEPQRFKFAGPFSIAVWFKVAQFSAIFYQPLITKGDASWRLQRHEATNTITFDTNYSTIPAGASDPPCRITNGRTDVVDRRWHLAVAVYEPAGNVAKKRLYIDGCLDAENETPLPLYQNDDPVWLGTHYVTEKCEFQGHIDEVAILGRALSAGEAMVMFEAGNPIGATDETTNK